MQNFFYATDDDEKAVWGTVFDIAGIQVFERWTDQKPELREFKTPEEIYIARANQSTHLEVCLLPMVGGAPTIEREYTDTGELWSQTLRGPTIISYMRYPAVKGCLNYSNFSAWNEIGARDRSIYDDEYLDCVDWKKFSFMFRKLRREMEKSSSAKLGSALVFPDAFAKLKLGEIRLWSSGVEASISSPSLVIKGGNLH